MNINNFKKTYIITQQNNKNILYNLKNKYNIYKYHNKRQIKCNSENIVLIPFAYGIIRKTIQLHSATIEDGKKIIPILNIDKFFIIILSSLLSLFMWPYFIYKDLKTIEILIISKSKPELLELYKKNNKTHIFDYIFEFDI